MNNILFVLYVGDQARSRDFYIKVLHLEPTLDVPGMTEFKLPCGGMLGLMPETGIKRLLGEPLPDPSAGNGIPRAELYLFVDDPEADLNTALAQGATLLSKVQPRDWGDLAGYCLDPDGNVVAFAGSLRA